MQGKFTDNLGRVYAMYTGGFLGFIILMAIFEQMGMSAVRLAFCLSHLPS